MDDIVKKIIYFFECKRCKKERRQSVDEARAEKGLCRTCRTKKVDPNQLSLLN